MYLRMYACMYVCMCACSSSSANGHSNAFVCLFSLLLNVPFHKLVYFRDGSAQTIFTCCHTEIEAADQTFYLTQSQYTDTGPTSPSADPITPGAWRYRVSAGTGRSGVSIL